MITTYKSKHNNITSFKNYCTCGGYAWTMNGRSEANPHMPWCPQYQEYQDWCQRIKKLEGIGPTKESDQ